MRESLGFFFETFRRTESACAVVKTFRQKALLFPRRSKKGPNKGDLVWAEIAHSRVLPILHNPRYAGAFVYMAEAALVIIPMDSGHFLDNKKTLIGPRGTVDIAGKPKASKPRPSASDYRRVFRNASAYAAVRGLIFEIESARAS